MTMDSLNPCEWKQSFNRGRYQTHGRDGNYGDIYGVEDGDIEGTGALASREPSPEFKSLIDELPEQEKKILELMAVGFTAQEVKDVLGTSQATLYRKIKNARKLLGE